MNFENFTGTLLSIFTKKGKKMTAKGKHYCVADMSPQMIDWGRKEIELAETEMPGLMALRKE